MFGSKQPVPAPDPRPRFMLKEQITLPGKLIYLLEDTETGIEYITSEGENAPITPVLDPDGTPHLSE